MLTTPEVLKAVGDFNVEFRLAKLALKTVIIVMKNQQMVLLEFILN